MPRFMAGFALALLVTLSTGGHAMGKGRIISGGTDGLYTIEILEDRTRAESNRTTAVARVASLDTRISELTVDLADAQSAVDNAAAYQDQMIADYQAALADDTIDTADARKAMTEAGEALIQAAAKRDAISRNIGALKSERLSVQKRIDLIDALPPLRQQDAWCADYTEDLAGDVATAEVPGEIGQVIIQPGYTDGAAWSPADDGAIQPSLSGTAASVFYNLAMMPGWQKWRPTFRIATISNISNDLCDITLDAATSSQQGLDVNAQGSYSGVPIMYMDCNGDAFEDGDRVLVAFSGNTDAPMVVGFEKEPKECLAYSNQIVVQPFVGIDRYYEKGITCDGSFERELGGGDKRLGLVALTSPPGLINYGIHPALNPYAKSSQIQSSDYKVVASSTAQTSGTNSDFTGDLSVTFDITQDAGGLADTSVVLTAKTAAMGSFSCPDGPSSTTVTERISTIQVGSLLLDLRPLDVDITAYSQGESSWRGFTDEIDDTFTLTFQREATGNLYLGVRFTSTQYGPITNLIRDSVAGFYREKGGSWYRVQARGALDVEQLPDYESLPIV